MDKNLILLIVLNVAFGIVLVYDIVLRIKERKAMKRQRELRRRRNSRPRYYNYRKG